MSFSRAASGLHTFADAVAVVTGGASGIGWALAQGLADRGAYVVIADRQVRLAEERVEEIAAAGGRASSSELDTRDPTSVRELVEGAFAENGRLDYLFNNAGIGVGGGVDQYSLDDWNDVLDVNLRGVVHGIHAAYPIFREQGFGHLVNTASVAGLIPSPFVTSYCASKHAVVGLSTSLRIEAAPFGVRVSVLCPGVIRTPILTGGRYGRMLVSVSEEERLAAWRRTFPMEPRRFAARTLRHVARNRAVIIVPGWWRALWWCYRVSPALSLVLGGWAYRSERQRLERMAAGSSAPD